jgi:hypothetical protein
MSENEDFSKEIIQICDIKVSKERFDKVDWKKIISDAPQKDCRHYSRLFNEAAKNEVLVERKNPLLLLGCITSLHLSETEKDKPFQPSIIMNGMRTADINDFSTEQLLVLKELLPEVDDDELNARLADVIWMRNRKDNFELAELAIDSYLKVGVTLIQSETPVIGISRLKRSLSIAITLGKGSKKILIIVDEIQRIIIDSKKCERYILELLNVLMETKQGDVFKLKEKAIKCADHESSNNNWYMERNYLEVAKSIAIQEKDAANLELLTNRICETFIRESEDAEKIKNYSVAASLLRSAIEIIRSDKGPSKKLKELHQKMLDLQRLSSEQMTSTSVTVNLTTEVEYSIAKVRNKSFNDAIIAFVSLQPLISYTRIKNQVEETAKEAPLVFLLPRNIVNRDGKVIAKKPTIAWNSPETIDELHESDIHFWAIKDMEASALIIEATRVFLLTEHNPTRTDLYFLSNHNPFIPESRRFTFTEGLFYGFQGDFQIAINLLVPQIENSIRYLLNNNGIITSGINYGGIQEEFDLNKLLEMEDVTNILGEDLSFSLKVLLTSKFGANFRNLLAHGLLDDNEVRSLISVYIWFLIPTLKKEE